MHRLRLSPILLAAALWAGAPAASLQPEARPVVALVSLDGFPAALWRDPALPAPTLRALAAAGAAAPMTPVNPSVTWPNHTTFVTGVSPARHDVLFNGRLLRQGPGRPVRVEPWRDKMEMVRAPTVYDVAHRAGLKTAQVDWVAIQRAPTIHWAFEERPDPAGPVARALVTAGLAAEADLRDFAKANIVRRDQLWTTAAVHIVRTYRPDLLLVHLLALDSVHHRYGPGTLAAYAAVSHLDAQVARLREAFASAGLLDRTTFLIVADHGFALATRQIRPNALLRREGLLRVDGEVACDAYVVPEGGTAMVFVTAAGDRAALTARLRALFERTEGIAQVLGPEAYAGLGLPTPAQSDQVGDLLLVAADGYAFSGQHEGEAVGPLPADANPGHHGYLSSRESMQALFLAAGRGIRRGARLQQVDARDVAPTAAALLGLELPGVDGRVLDELLEPD
ncbi:MAG TPA: alkaline phosphatase family protein, partial [Vicinamibacterales bacterium]|nr:alkaline phosphatase family protein [Vicinamibacterales bacterium]